MVNREGALPGSSGSGGGMGGGAIGDAGEGGGEAGGRGSRPKSLLGGLGGFGRRRSLSKARQIPLSNLFDGQIPFAFDEAHHTLQVELSCWLGGRIWQRRKLVGRSTFSLEAALASLRQKLMETYSGVRGVGGAGGGQSARGSMLALGPLPRLLVELPIMPEETKKRQQQQQQQQSQQQQQGAGGLGSGRGVASVGIMLVELVFLVRPYPAHRAT